MENEEIISFMATDNWTQFLLWERASRDTVDFKKIYVDMAGDLIAGLLLNQIVYWYLPTKDGSSKLRVFKGDHYWIAKARGAWWEEVRITAKQVDRALKVLEKKGLIFTHLYRFQGAPTKHIRIDTKNFLEAWKVALDFTQRSKSILPKGQNRIAPEGEMDIDQRGNFLTETTPETTKEGTERKSNLFEEGDGYLAVAAKCEAARQANGNFAATASAGGSDAAAEAALVAMYDKVGSEPPQKGTKAWDLEIGIVSEVLLGRKVTDPDIAKKAGELFGQSNRETPQFANPSQTTFPSAFGLFVGKAKKQADRGARGQEITEASQAAFAERMAANSQEVEDDEVGMGVKIQLQLQMTKATFDTWVKPTSIVLNDGVLQVTVPNAVHRDWLENRLMTTIKRTAIGVVGKEVEVEIGT